MTAGNFTKKKKTKVHRKFCDYETFYPIYLYDLVSKCQKVFVTCGDL